MIEMLLASLLLVVDRSDLELTVYDDDIVVATYPVAMGKPSSYTPLGEFNIKGIIFNPDWNGTRGQGYVPSGPRNPLGRISLRYDMPYALHGNNNPASIGTYASLGCIRMHNKDIIELTARMLKENNQYRSDAWYNSHFTGWRRSSMTLTTPVKIRIVE